MPFILTTQVQGSTHSPMKPNADICSYLKLKRSKCEPHKMISLDGALKPRVSQGSYKTSNET